MPYTTLESLTPIQSWLLFNVANMQSATYEKLVGASKFPRTTITDNMRIMTKWMLFSKDRIHTGKRGRPPTVWKPTEFCYRLLREGEIDE